MLIGYARTSTIDQKAGLEAQMRDLESAGVDKVFQEQVSSVTRRDQLEAAIDFVREGDRLVVTRLDRLARSTAHLLGSSWRKQHTVGLGTTLSQPRPPFLNSN